MQEDIEVNSYKGFCLQVPSCMYEFLASFGMQCICMWFFGHDLSLAWRNAWIDGGFLSLVISWIAMVLWVSFLWFSGLFSCSFGCELSY